MCLSVRRFVEYNICRKFALFCLVHIKRCSFLTSCVFWFVCFDGSLLFVSLFMIENHNNNNYFVADSWTGSLLSTFPKRPDVHCTKRGTARRLCADVPPGVAGGETAFLTATAYHTSTFLTVQDRCFVILLRMDDQFLGIILYDLFIFLFEFHFCVLCIVISFLLCHCNRASVVHNIIIAIMMRKSFVHRNLWKSNYYRA